MKLLTVYGTLLGVYALSDMVGILGLNLQFGYAGLGNFAFIAYVAIGAYAYAILTLGSPTHNFGFQHFIGGVNWPFPLPYIGAIVIGCVFGAVSGLVLLRRLRVDYQYLLFFAFAFVASGIAVGVQGLVNGATGLSLIPAPLTGVLKLSPLSSAYGGIYLLILLAFTCVAFWMMTRVMGSPWGRLLRAGRDNDLACATLGRNPATNRYIAFVVGSGYAALSGALLVGYVSAWSPSSWTLPETVVFFIALIVGGAGNNVGAIVGVIVVQIVITQLPQFLPSFASPSTFAAIQWMVIGVLIMGFIWFRPQGLLAQRVPQYKAPQVRPEPAGEVLSAASSPPSGQELQGRQPLAQKSSGANARPMTSRLGSDLTGTSLSAGLKLNKECANELMRVEGLAKRFGGVVAVSTANLTIPSGQITGLMGPNGAGKSTLVSMLAGEVSPSSGHVYLNGADVTGSSAIKMARAGVVRTFQLSSEFRTLSVIENLLVGWHNRHGERFSDALLPKRRWKAVEDAALVRAWELLEDFEMSSLANVRAAALSGGQRRLVELMRALMTNPAMLLLDEPLAGIARGMGEVIIGKLKDLRSGGVTILLVEHELRELHRVADGVVVMARGSTIAAGAMAEVVERPEVRQAYVAG